MKYDWEQIHRSRGTEHSCTQEQDSRDEWTEREETGQRPRLESPQSVTWQIRRHQLLPDRAQGLRNRKISSLLDQRSWRSQLCPPTLSLPSEIQGWEMLRKANMGEGELAAGESEQAFQAAQQAG